MCPDRDPSVENPYAAPETEGAKSAVSVARGAFVMETAALLLILGIIALLMLPSSPEGGTVRWALACAGIGSTMILASGLLGVWHAILQHFAPPPEDPLQDGLVTKDDSSPPTSARSGTRAERD